MGRPMAMHLVEAGYEVTVWNRTQAKAAPLVDAGARRAASPKDAAARSEITITMVADTPDVRQVILGPDGVIEGVRSGSIVVDMSTIAPVATREIAAALADRGAAMLDAPVSGGEKGAIDGTLSIMVGGEAQDFERALPVFQVLGKTITHMGTLGSGGFTKLANQIIVAI